MPFQDEVAKCKGLLISSLPFFLVMIDSWWQDPNLDKYPSRMRFFSLVPETDEDMSDNGVGSTAAHKWLFAGSWVAFLVDGATGNADVVEVIAPVGCLIDCLGFDLFLMTKELCSLLLSPCSKEVSCGREGRITWGGDGRANPGKTRWISASGQYYLNNARQTWQIRTSWCA